MKLDRAARSRGPRRPPETCRKPRGKNTPPAARCQRKTQRGRSREGEENHSGLPAVLRRPVIGTELKQKWGKRSFDLLCLPGDEVNVLGKHPPASAKDRRGKIRLEMGFRWKS